MKYIFHAILQCCTSVEIITKYFRQRGKIARTEIEQVQNDQKKGSQVIKTNTEHLAASSSQHLTGENFKTTKNCTKETTNMRIYIIIKKVCKKCLFKNIYRGNLSDTHIG